MRSASNSAERELLSTLLRRARIEAKLSQEDLAGLLGRTQSEVSKVERGVRSVDLIELRRWTAAVGVSFVEFVEALDQKLTAKEALAAKLIKGAPLDDHVR